MEDDSDDSALNELFVQETLDPRIESVMPILNKLSKNLGEMKEVSELAEWADSLTEAPGAETLAHNQATEKSRLDAFDLDEGDGGQEALNPGGIPEGMLDGSGDIDSPVANAITRRILMQRTDLLSKYGPEKISQAIGDIAEFVGDVDEIGSSDVSGWIKQIERELSQHDSGGEKLSPDTYELIDDYIAKIEPDADREEIAQSIINGTIHTSELEYALQDELEEGIIDKIKDVGQKALNKRGHGSDEDLLKDLKKRAGVRNPETGKPSMAHSDVEKVDEEVDESALQAYLGDKKYGKDGMDALRKAGRDDASKEEMAKIRAKFDKIDEDEFAGDYATGEAGQWSNKGPKANKPATVGDLVGESQLNEMDKSEDGKGLEGKAKPIKAKDMAKDAEKKLEKHMDKAHKKDVKEGQEDLDAILRIIKK
jgi:hypothetical protein